MSHQMSMVSVICCHKQINHTQVNCKMAIHRRSKCQLGSIVLRGYYTGNWDILFLSQGTMMHLRMSFKRQMQMLNEQVLQGIAITSLLLTNTCTSYVVCKF